MYLLLVDYDLFSSAEVQEMLKQSPEGTDIINCITTATLLRTAEKLNPDVIIIDYALVQDEEVDLFTDLRKKSKGAHILALLDLDHYEQLYKVIEAGGVDDYIVKPIRKEDFLARVQIAAKRKRADRGFEEPDLRSTEASRDDSTAYKSTGSESEADLNDQLLAETDISELMEDDDSLQLEDQDESITEPSVQNLYGDDDLDLDSQEEELDLPYENDEPELEFIEETIDSGSKSEEDDTVHEELDYLNESEFAPDDEVLSEDESSEGYSFDDIMPKEEKEDFAEVDRSTEKQNASSDLFADIDGIEADKDFGEESLQDLFEEETTLTPEDKDSGKSEEGLKSFEDVLKGPSEDDNLDLSVEEFYKSRAEDAGPADAKPPAESLDREKRQDSQQQKSPFVSPLQSEEDNLFETLFDEKPQTGDENKTPGSEKTSSEESFFEQDDELDWGETSIDKKTQPYGDSRKPGSKKPVSKEPFFEQDDELDWGEAASTEYPEDQPLNRKSLKEHASLQGESADEFLYGSDGEQEEVYSKSGLDDFTDYFDEESEESGRPKTRRKSGGGSRSILGFFGNLLFIILLLFMATLSFFLIQSRLSGGAPEVAGYQMYIVLSGSMSPEFDTGSLAFVRETDTDQLVVGDIITYRTRADSDSLTTHRIVEIRRNGDTRFVTRGDANNVNDPTPIPAENVVGRVTGSVPYVGYLLDFVQTRMGLILLIFVPGLLIILYELGKIMKYVTQGNDKKRRKADKKRSSFAEE